jgi:gamma-glutamylcyclotransferase (GGCT)/AIG2-like uncharacterized protein YtfP
MNNYPQRLFVYSSLRSGFQHPAYAYISKYFMLESEAHIKGKLFDLGNNIVGVPADENFFIKGELYLIKNPDEFSWALAQLDDYEGINGEEGETPLYIRNITTAYFNHHQDEAWVYWFNQPLTNGKLIESGDLLAYLLEKK